jgi:glycerophosphoryl diester phosphodiesterase
MKLRLLGNLFWLPVFALVVALLIVVSPDAAAGNMHINMTDVSAMRRACTDVQAAGHRGLGPGTHWVAGVEYTEDTIKSANGAYYYGADVSKADLHMSAEGTWFILHDSDLTRVTNGRDHRMLRSMTDAQIRAVILPDGSHIPSLADYLSNLRYGNDGRYVNRMAQLEVKRQAHALADMQRVVDLIYAYGLQGQVILIASKNALLREMRSVAPEIPRTYVWYANGTHPAPSRLIRGLYQMVNVDYSQATARYVRALHKRGFKVAARSANSSKQWRRLLHRAATALPDQISTDKMPAFNGWCRSQ